MEQTFLGVRYLIWAVVCVLIAVVYALVWPRPKSPEHAKSRGPIARVVLRWFHSLTWSFLAGACIVGDAMGSGAGDWLALAALATYFFFLAVFLVDHAKQKKT
jgi:hypothetical protein